MANLDKLQMLGIGIALVTIVMGLTSTQSLLADCLAEALAVAHVAWITLRYPNWFPDS